MKVELKNPRNFAKEIKKSSGIDVYACYQCGKCTAGCPVAMEMDYRPNQVIRMTQLGCTHEVLNSHAIWICASCVTCSTRCPKNVDITGLMDVLRIIAQKRGYKPKEKGVGVMNDIFLHSIKTRGRVQETLLAMRFNLKTGQLFKDMQLGQKLFMKGKIKIKDSKILGIQEMRPLFDKAKAFFSVEET
ncbi:MAG: 4Fe-4S dicluster domain-containing protein [Thermodesulfobacteriota bacterium]|nr:4Fe-4S dicluster domain-containing protein [Thermodesulfobacteriota bacterium]